MPTSVWSILLYSELPIRHGTCQPIYERLLNYNEMCEGLMHGLGG